MAESVVPNTSLSAASEPAFDIVCQPCGSEGKHAEAEGYCIDCCEHLCVHCIGVHKKYAGLKHHMLLDKAEMPQKQDTSQVRDVCTERCQIHREKIIEYFCPIHKVLGCSVCITLKHCSCDDVIYIPEVAPGLENSDDFKDFMAKLNELTRKSKDTTKFAEESKTRASDCHDKATQKLDSYRQELVDAIDKQVQGLKDLAKQKHTQDTGKMKTLVDDSNAVFVELQSMTSELSSLQGKKQYCQLFFEMKTKEQKLTELRGRLEDLEGDGVSAYDFQPDEQVPAMIRKNNGLGQVVMKSSKKSGSMPKETSGSLPQAIDGPSPQDNPGYLLQAKSKVKADGKKPSVTWQYLLQGSATWVSDISVKTTGNNKTCKISGMALLSAERLVAADWNNNAIKLIDTHNNTILSEFNPDGKPWDVTVCEGEVAATLPIVSKIVFLKFDNGLVHARDMPVSGKCRGIDCADGKLFVIYDKEKKLEVMTVTGTVLQKFETDNQGANIFKDPTYVTASAASQSLYVSEWGEGRIVILSLNGNFKGDYKNDKLKRPRQLVADRAGAMYLCDYSQDSIHLMPPLCQKMEVLLQRKDGLNNPYSICYCERKGRLYVGMLDNTIRVYQVSYD